MGEARETEYKCAACGQTFEKGWTDEEAKAEFASEFEGHDPDDVDVVCDDCYKRIMDGTHGR